MQTTSTTNKQLLLKNATLWASQPDSPHEFSSFESDVLVTNGIIQKVEKNISASEAHIIDLTGLHLCPGFIDTQVHFREPGLEHKEDLNTGTAGAAMGGITAVFEMPNTSPSTLTEKDFFNKVERTKGRAWTDVAFYIGASEENIDELAELETLPGCSGIKLFMGSSTGSLLVDQDELLDKVVKNGKRRFAVHCEDEATMNKNKKEMLDENSTVHDHPRWRSAEAALTATTKIVELAKKYGRPVHVLHITTYQEIEYLAQNKEHCSVECTPQHLTLYAPECYDRLGTLAQMNPPIRTKEHQDGLWKGVNNFVVDIIGSDHAPHTLSEKQDFKYPKTPSGMTGVQTILPIMLDHVSNGRLTMQRLLQLMVSKPIDLFKVKNRGFILPGYEGTFTVIDPNKSQTITNKWIKSRSGWTPFDGVTVKGWPTHTIIRGHVVMQNDQLLHQPQGQMLEFAID